eukprot:4793445-Amphidinium_carterae.1
MGAVRFCYWSVHGEFFRLCALIQQVQALCLACACGKKTKSAKRVARLLATRAVPQNRQGFPGSFGNHETSKPKLREELRLRGNDTKHALPKGGLKEFGPKIFPTVIEPDIKAEHTASVDYGDDEDTDMDGDTPL